ncbi:MAG: acetylglutamate kinase [Nitrospinota bacterium]
MEKLIERAQVLIEALPYIRRFAGKSFVIKCGGTAMAEEALRASFAQDVVLARYVGIQPVIVHGGGPEISATLRRLGKESRFVEGLRVTDEETMGVVEMVLTGPTNKEIVRLINRHGGRATGLSGSDADLITARRLTLTRKAAGGGEEEVDLGQVGEVVRVDPRVVRHLEEGGLIPVIAPTGVGEDGVVYNINADTVAGALAGALGAEKLIFLTDVPGILDRDGKLLSHLDRAAVASLREAGVVAGGMIPKVEACVRALEEGVQKTHIIDGRVPHALLLEIFTDKGIGTEIVL